MTLDEKLSFVSGGSDPQARGQAGYIPGVPRLGIPELRLTDGPDGIRVNNAPTTALPALVVLASSFDDRISRTYGQTLGKTGRAMGEDVLLAPMTNTIRAPNAGRNFETFSEDPVLNPHMVSQEQASDRLASLTDATTRCHRSRPRALEAEIASHQHLSLATVKAHAARLLAKLDVDNQVQIALLVKRPSQDAPNERGRCAVSRTSLDECLRAGRATSLATVTVPFEAPVRTAARLGSVVTRN